MSLLVLLATNSAEQFVSLAKLPTADQLVLHVWPDCTLHHLITLSLATHATPLPPPHLATTLSFALVYPDRTGKHVLRQVGQVVYGGEGEEDEAGRRTLRELKLEIGDYIDVAVMSDGSLQPLTPHQPTAARTTADAAG